MATRDGVNRSQIGNINNGGPNKGGGGYTGIVGNVYKSKPGGGPTRDNNGKDTSTYSVDGKGSSSSK